MLQKAYTLPTGAVKMCRENAGNGQSEVKSVDNLCTILRRSIDRPTVCRYDLIDFDGLVSRTYREAPSFIVYFSDSPSPCRPPQYFDVTDHVPYEWAHRAKGGASKTHRSVRKLRAYHVLPTPRYTIGRSGVGHAGSTSR